MSGALFLKVAKDIRDIVEVEGTFLRSLDEESINHKFNPQNRSIKQIVGQLVDLASDNLRHIVHLQYSDTPLILPDYADTYYDRRLAIQHFQDEDWYTLTHLWIYSNLHITHVIRHIDPDKANHKRVSAPPEEVSLEDVVLDYLLRLMLHIKAIHAIYNSR